MNTNIPTPEAGTGEEILLVPANRIRRNGRQPRQTFIKSDLEELAASIKEKGQRVPIEVRRLAGGLEHDFEIIDGESRWRSVTQHIDPAFQLRCIVTTVKNDEEQFERSLIANMHRKDLPALDTAFALKREHGEFGKSLEYLARLFGKSVSWVQNYIGLTTLPKEIRAMMDPNLPDNQQLNVTVAVIISKMKSKGKQLALAEEAVREGLSIRAVVARLKTIEPAAIRTEHDGKVIQPKPSDAYGALLGLVARTNQRFNDYLNLQPDLQETVNVAIGKRPEKEDDAMAIIFFCDQMTASLKKIKDAVKKVK